MNGSSVGVSSSFGENAAICLQRRCRPDCKSHLALTVIAAVDSDSCVAPLRQRLNRCDVHFAAALTGGAFCATAPTIARTCLGVLFRYRISQVSRGRIL